MTGVRRLRLGFGGRREDAVFRVADMRRMRGVVRSAIDALIGKRGVAGLSFGRVRGGRCQVLTSSGVDCTGLGQIGFALAGRARCKQDQACGSQRFPGDRCGGTSDTGCRRNDFGAKLTKSGAESFGGTQARRGSTRCDRVRLGSTRALQYGCAVAVWLRYRWRSTEVRFS
jgi:hypothetical protein